MLKIKYRSMKPGRRTIDSLLSHNGCRIEVSTGITVPDGVLFQTPRSFVGGHPNDRAELEGQLSEWESKVRNRYASIVSTHGYSFPADVFKASIKLTVSEARGSELVDSRATLSGFIDQFRDRMETGLLTKKSNGKPYSPSTIKLMGYSIGMIEEFISKHGDFDFAKYNLDTEASVGKSTVVRAWDDLCEGYKAFLIKDKKLGNNSVCDAVTKASMVIRERCDAHGINISPRYTARLKYRSSGERIVVALSQEQFEWILNNEQKIRDDNKFVKGASDFVDFIIAGLLTAARIGDLSRLTTNNLIKTQDGYILSYIPQKTKNSSGMKVEIPVPDRLVNIFLRNAENHGGKLLHPKKDYMVQDASIITKRILRRYEIFHNIVHIQNSHGDIIAVPFWKAFKFHSTRASLITYLLRQGEQETIIKSISGHTLDSHSFSKYTDITNSMKVRTMQKVAMIGVV